MSSSLKLFTELPKLGVPVEITLKNGSKRKAILTETSFYASGVVYEDSSTMDYRVEDVVSWEYI